MNKLLFVLLIVGTYFKFSNQEKDYIDWYEQNKLCTRKEVKYDLNPKPNLIPISSAINQFSVEIKFGNKVNKISWISVLHEQPNQTDRIGGIDFKENIYVGYQQVKILNESLIKFFSIPMSWENQRIILIYYMVNPLSDIPFCFQIPFPRFERFSDISCPKNVVMHTNYLDVECKFTTKGNIPKLLVFSSVPSMVQLESSVTQINDGDYKIKINGKFDSGRTTLTVFTSEKNFSIERNFTVIREGTSLSLSFLSDYTTNYCENNNVKLSCFSTDDTVDAKFKFIGPNDSFITEKYGGFLQSITIDANEYPGNWTCIMQLNEYIYNADILVQHTQISKCPFTVELDNKPAKDSYIFGTKNFGRILTVNCSKRFYAMHIIYGLSINRILIAKNNNGYFKFKITKNESFTLRCNILSDNNPWKHEINFKYIKITKPMIKYDGEITNSIYFHRDTNQPIKVQCSSQADEEIILYRLMQAGTSRGSVQKDGNFVIPFKKSSAGEWICVAESLNSISESNYLKVSVEGEHGDRYFTESQKIIVSVSCVVAFALMVITILTYRYISDD